MSDYSDLDQKLIRKPFVKNPVLVTGLTRAGKSMMSPIVASLKRAELLQVHHLMEQFPMLHNLSLISDQVAIYLLRYAMDFMLIDTYMGRNVNFRHADASSVWNSRDPKMYFERLYSKDGDDVLQRIDNDDPVIVWSVHYGLWHVPIYLKAFSDMKMVHVCRHPVDLIHSWYLKGYGKEFVENPRNGALTIQGDHKIISYFGIGWEELYEKSSEMDRIIRTIAHVENNHKQRYQSLSEKQREQVLMVYFEEVVTQTDSVLSEICSFLNMEPSTSTHAILERERCPRELRPEDRAKKLEEIKSLASAEVFSILESMIEAYESKTLYTEASVIGEM